MSQVSVYILSPDANSYRTEQVKSLFNNNLFIVYIVTISPPNGIKETPTLNLMAALEAYRVSWCLKHAQNNHPENYVIVIKDTSVSNASPDRIADIISAATSSKDWQLCYLCRWLDRCDLYTEKKPITGMTTLIAKTQSPQGVQAIMFSPDGRDIILGTKSMKNGSTFTPITKPLGTQLNDAITNGWIDATCIVPNLIEFDATAAKTADDYKKLSECIVPPSEPIGPSPGVIIVPGSTGATGATGQNNKNLQEVRGLSGWWFILIIVIVLIIIALFMYNSKSKPKLI